MTELKTFEDLEAWKACRELRLFVSRQVIPHLPKDEVFRLKDQLARAARSTTANVAEGYRRFHFKDNAKFIRQARGSAYEVLDHLITGCDEQLIDARLVNDFRPLLERTVRIPNGYIRFLNRSADTGSQG